MYYRVSQAEAWYYNAEQILNNYPVIKEKYQFTIVPLKEKRYKLERKLYVDIKDFTEFIQDLGESYIIDCTSEWKAKKIIEKYPIIKKYDYEIDKDRLLVEIDDLIKFAKDVKKEIIIITGQYNDGDKGFVTLEIYDTWRE
jgi:hypothetical protein